MLRRTCIQLRSHKGNSLQMTEEKGEQDLLPRFKEYEKKNCADTESLPRMLNERFHHDFRKCQIVVLIVAQA